MEKNKSEVSNHLDGDQIVRNQKNAAEGKPHSETPALKNNVDNISMAEIAFCDAIVEFGDRQVAYQAVFDTEGMSFIDITHDTHRILGKPCVQEHLRKSREFAAYSHSVTVTSQANKLQKIYEQAMAEKKYAPAVAAVVNQSKLYGLVTDAEAGKQEHNINLVIQNIQQGRRRAGLKDVTVGDKDGQKTIEGNELLPAVKTKPSEENGEALVRSGRDLPDPPAVSKPVSTTLPPKDEETARKMPDINPDNEELSNAERIRRRMEAIKRHEARGGNA